MAVSKSAQTRVPLAAVASLALIGIPFQTLNQIIGIYLPRFYVHLGLGFIAVSTALSVIRLADAFLDPMLSVFMDRTRTLIGRYRPWLIAGAPIGMLAAYMLTQAKPGVGAGYLTLWLLVAFAALSVIELSAAAWLAVLSKSYDDRSRVFGITIGVREIGPVLLFLLPLLSAGRIVPGEGRSMPAIGWMIVLAFPVCVAVSAIFTPEPVARRVNRPRFALKDYWAAISRPSMLRVVLADLFLVTGPTTIGPILIYFFHDAKGFKVGETSILLAFNLFARIVGSPIWGRVAKRFNKHRTVQIACLAYCVAQAVMVLLLPRGAFLITGIGMFAVGFTGSAFLPLIRAMLADISDEVRLDLHQDMTSLLYSMVTTTAKLASTLSVLIVFPILAAIGYDGREAAHNTPGAILGLKLCYLLAPTSLVLLGAAALIGYRLDDKRHAEVRAALDARDAAEREAQIPPAAASGLAASAP